MKKPYQSFVAMQPRTMLFHLTGSLHHFIQLTRNPFLKEHEYRFFTVNLSESSVSRVQSAGQDREDREDRQMPQ